MQNYVLLYEEYSNDPETFWGNAGAGVLPICTSTGKILLGHRSPDVKEPNTWGAFGGKIDEDKGETEADAIGVAERELREETGYNGKVKLIPSYIYITPKRTFKYFNFISLVDEEFEPELSWETDEARWFTLDDLKHIDRKDYHFGLKLLFDHDLDTIKKYAK